jgi:hypothetical protein
VADHQGSIVPADTDVLVSSEYTGIGNGSSDRWQLPAMLPPDYPKFNPLIFSLETMLPFIDFHQESYWHPDSHGVILLIIPLRWYFWIHIAVGWTLSSLMVAGFAGLVRIK